MTSLILVTGGTGTLGRHVVPRLRDTGRDIRVLSRHHRAAEDGIEYMTGDLLSGDGIEPAVDGAEVIVHCAGARKGDDEATRNLMRAASRAGTQHVVYISVDRGGPDPGDQRHRPGDVRLLRDQAGRGASRGRLRRAVDDAAGRPVL